ncbi:MAG TPA: AbrB/MazE/SpoVT family DNA-binding domain-containing protein [Nanoarchaeota archaeon]|nr:AbrB/MazE/SpoVT family DNA-binding domain-containing protein [Nanoarchaeota archaeon]
MEGMKAITRTRKIGGSLIVAIPRELVIEEGLKEGEVVEVKVRKVKKDFFGALKGIGPMTKEDKFKGQLEENE